MFRSVSNIARSLGSSAHRCQRFMTSLARYSKPCRVPSLINSSAPLSAVASSLVKAIDTLVLPSSSFSSLAGSDDDEGSLTRKHKSDDPPPDFNRPLNTLLTEAQTNLKTIRDILRFAVTLFRNADLAPGQNCTEVTDDALLMILTTFNIPLISKPSYEAFFDSRLTPSEISQVLNNIRIRIEKRVPTAYITKKALFGEFEFYCDQRVVIPRSLLQEVICNSDQMRYLWTEKKPPRRALDMCTGSGNLAILLADAFPKCGEIDAVDISADALSVAHINVKKYNLISRINLIQSSMFEKLPKSNVYDVIISNPPYVPRHSLKTLPPEFRYEPQIGLEGGEDGLDYVRQIIIESESYLSQNGVLIVECGNKRTELEYYFPHLGFEWLTTSVSKSDVFALPKAAYATYHAAMKAKELATVKSTSTPPSIPPQNKSPSPMNIDIREQPKSSRS
eukprot:TRINITY_DN1907_c0_g1_i1.p1 TRINITY_DN1907_c0_g1~~TRINITY_DN1907_c0_g1_i1.p1  ORF type:complete len:449 (-),score=75.74 TRINITY_DN1907_c0_g1_i1:80-1426(-)